MDWKEYKHLLFSDFYRYEGRCTWFYIIRQVMLDRCPGQSISWHLRSCAYLKDKCLLRPLYYLFRYLLRRCMFKYGIEVWPECRIGPGLYIGHFGGIHISYLATIGSNCNISHDVTIGRSNRGEHTGIPVLGDNVFVGPGAKLFGNIRVGNNAAIGVNCVVMADVPDNAVIVGIPGRVISYKGSKGYINKTDWNLPRVSKDTRRTQDTIGSSLCE
ncbi:MAG: serine acetyltransferase [Planctomycetes bacterium]|nr:serine acetyltransferase [Planctomycetota bacterium]